MSWIARIVGAWRDWQSRRRRADREAAILATRMPARAAWLHARERRRAAEAGRDEDDARHWNRVLRSIERLTGYHHQPDTATRWLEPR